MKFFKTACFFLMTAGLLSSCIGDEEEDCPPVVNPTNPTGTRAATLLFMCPDGASDLFAQEVTNRAGLPNGGTVQVYVYNRSTGALVAQKTVSNAELRNFQGAEQIKLDPGTYEVRCWANASSNTTIYNESTLNGARLSTPYYYPLPQTVQTNDPLYYGAKTITIAETTYAGEEITDTIPFKLAHVHLNITVSGLKQQPKIEVTNLYPIYDFSMNVLNTPVSYYPILTSYNIATGTASTSLDVLRFAYNTGSINYNYTNSIKINILDAATDTALYTVNMRNWMNSRGITIDASKANNIVSVPDTITSTTQSSIILPITLDVKKDSTVIVPADTVIIKDTVVIKDTVPITPPVPPRDEALYFHLYQSDCQYSDVFSKYISSVELCAFEKKSGNLVYRETIAAADLASFQGKKLSLSPIGASDTTATDYEIRCWANLTSQTSFNSSTSLVNSYVTSEQYAGFVSNNGDTIRTNDQLYFGEASVHVTKDNQYLDGDVNFRLAHNTFDIALKGLPFNTDTVPVVEVEGLAAAYDFYMDDKQWSPVPYFPTMTYQTADTVSRTMFNSLRITEQNKQNIKILVKNKVNNSTLLTLTGLSVAISDTECYGNIFVNGSLSGSTTIPIQVIFRRNPITGVIDLGLTIVVVGWTGSSISPSI